MIWEWDSEKVAGRFDKLLTAEQPTATEIQERAYHLSQTNPTLPPEHHLLAAESALKQEREAARPYAPRLLGGDPLPFPKPESTTGHPFIEGLVRSTPLHTPPKPAPSTPAAAGQALIAQGLLEVGPRPQQRAQARQARAAATSAQARTTEAITAYEARRAAAEAAQQERIRAKALLPDQWDRMLQAESTPVWAEHSVGLTPTNVGRGLQAFHAGVVKPIGSALKATGSAIAREPGQQRGAFMKGWNWARGLRQ